MANIDTFEICWIVFAFLVSIRATYTLVETFKDWRVVQRRHLDGPLHTVAKMGLVGSVLRLLCAVLFLAVAIQAGLHPPAAEFPSLEALLEARHISHRNALIGLTLILGASVFVDAWYRGRLRQTIKYSPKRRRITDHLVPNGPTREA